MENSTAPLESPGVTGEAAERLPNRIVESPVWHFIVEAIGLKPAERSATDDEA